MPVQFVCSQCGRRLSVARRKAGAHVACPKCGGDNLVPLANGAVAPPPQMTAPRPESPHVGSSYDEVGDLFAAPPKASATDARSAYVAAPPVVRAATGRGPVPTPPPREAQQAPGRASREILVNRKLPAGVLWGLAIAAAALMAFLIGLAVGRAFEDPRGQEHAGDPVVVQGKVLYSPAPDALVADAGALVVALPASAHPAHKLSAVGLRPEDARGAGPIPAAATIAQLGGDWTRTDELGAFQLVLPRPGEYRLLLVSQHAQRREGDAIAPGDLRQLSEIFQAAPEVLGWSKYRWTEEKLMKSSARVEHHFGKNERQ